VKKIVGGKIMAEAATADPASNGIIVDADLVAVVNDDKHVLSSSSSIDYNNDMKQM